MTFAELGRRVSLSAPAAAERVQRLERAGVITGYRAEIDPRALGYALTAIIRVKAVGRPAAADPRARGRDPRGRRVPPHHGRGLLLPHGAPAVDRRARPAPRPLPRLRRDDDLADQRDADPAPRSAALAVSARRSQRRLPRAVRQGLRAPRPSPRRAASAPSIRTVVDSSSASRASSVIERIAVRANGRRRSGPLDLARDGRRGRNGRGEDGRARLRLRLDRCLGGAGAGVGPRRRTTRARAATTREHDGKGDDEHQGTLGSPHDGGEARVGGGGRPRPRGGRLVRPQRERRTLARRRARQVHGFRGEGLALPAARNQHQRHGSGRADDDVPPRECAGGLPRRRGRVRADRQRRRAAAEDAGTSSTAPPASTTRSSGRATDSRSSSRWEPGRATRTKGSSIRRIRSHRSTARGSRRRRRTRAGPIRAFTFRRTGYEDGWLPD